MRMPPVAILLSCALPWYVGCKDSFNPKGGFEQKLVVYSVLSNESTIQFVRVYSTYDVDGFDPFAQTSDDPVTDAHVAMTNSGAVYVFSDTLVQRADTSRFASRVLAYVSHSIVVEPKQTYVLVVNSPARGSASASTTVPEQGSIQIPDAYFLLNPVAYVGNALEVVSTVSPIAKGFLTRLFVDFRITNLNNRVVRMEVPFSMTHSTDTSGGSENLIPQYPTLHRASEPWRTQRYDQSVSFAMEAYIYALRQIAARYGSDHIQFIDAVFYLYQVDANLYNYYNIANGFQDRYTIRTDEPDYTNIQNGVGVFGSMRVDSTTVSLPATIPF